MAGMIAALDADVLVPLPGVACWGDLEAGIGSRRAYGSDLPDRPPRDLPPGRRAGALGAG